MSDDARCVVMNEACQQKIYVLNRCHRLVPASVLKRSYDITTHRLKENRIIVVDVISKTDVQFFDR